MVNHAANPLPPEADDGAAAVKIPNDSTPPPDGSGPDHWLRRQFNWEHVEHLIKEGKILSLVYDTETTDLNPMFGALTQFSGKVVTLDGRIIDALKLDIQVPEDVAISPQAALVTQSHPEELYRAEGRVPPHIAAGKIMLFFKNPYRKLWDMLGEMPDPDQKIRITIKGNGGKEEEVRVYTITSPDGKHKAEIRLHQGGKFLSYRYPDEHLPDGARTYRDEDGTRWKRIEAPAMTHGHNIRRFDDRMLWATLHRAMSDEIFLTHTKKYRRFRVDTLDLARLVALLDQDGENGFKPGTKIDRQTGRPYTSFTLSSLMEANTRDPNPERNLDEGVRMPDGSKYDSRLAHQDAAYDVKATLALMAYMRKRAPDVVRMVEINSDFDRIKPFLIGNEGLGLHPVLAFARYVHPHEPSLHFGVCAGINEEIEERRQAVMIRTDLDQPLKDYTYPCGKRKKKLVDMTVDELADMLKEQRGKPDALCEVIDLRKNPPIVPAEMAFKRGKGRDGKGSIDHHEENRRFVMAHKELCEKLIKAHGKAMPPMPDFRSIPLPQAEEHLFTGIASPKQYEFDMGGKKVLLTEKVHAAWKSALDHNRAVDTLLRRAIKPQPVEFEVRRDTLDAFIERMKTIDKDLQRYLSGPDQNMPGGAHPAASGDDGDEGQRTDGAGQAGRRCFRMLPEPDLPFIPPKWDTVPDPDREGKTMKVPHVMSQEELERLTANATEYLWKLRAEFMYEFHDNTTRFTLQREICDEHGHKVLHDIPFPVLNAMHPRDISNRLQNGEFKLNMESLNWSAELIARMFRDAGRIGWVKQYMAERGRDAEVSDWEKWEEYFAALRALRMHGAPHEDPDDHRWMSLIRGMKEVERIRANLGPDGIRAEGNRWGQWDIFMDGDEAEPILKEYEAFASRRLTENPLTHERMRRVGYDPEKGGLPIVHTPYEVPAGAKVLTIDVPDRMLEEPLSHNDVAHKIVMLDPSAAERRALANVGRDTFLFLRGAQSGRTYLAAKPAVLSPDKIAPHHHAHNFQEVYAEAATRFVDSGMTPPEPERFLPIAVEELEPIPGKVDLAVQTVKIPRWEDFMATVSPALGYRDRDEPLTGLVIKHYGYTPVPGPVRLQGMVHDDKKPGLTESGWEVPTTIRQVRTMTLKEARKRIEAGHEQIKAVIALEEAGAPLEEVSIQAVRNALASNGITEAKAEEAGTNLKSLRKLMEKESFSHRDAIHYGYTSLMDMKSKLTDLFVGQERDAGRDDNLLHFVDIDEVKKENMRWYRPASRPMVSLAGDVVNIMPPPVQDREGPDPSHVHGAPDIERGHRPDQQEKT